MPVRKYRSIEDVPSALILDDGDASEAFRLACELSELTARLSGWNPPSGVHKFRSLEDAQAQRLAWERAARPQTPPRSDAV